MLVVRVLKQAGPLQQQRQGVLDQVEGGEGPGGVQALVEEGTGLQGRGGAKDKAVTRGEG